MEYPASAHRFAEDVTILKVVVAELPVGAAHGAIEVKGVEDAKERVPEIFVREGLVRQRAGPPIFTAMLSWAATANSFGRSANGSAGDGGSCG